MAPASATTAEITRSPWQMHIDLQPHGPLSNSGGWSHGDPLYYVDARVPLVDAASWQPAPDGQIIGFDGRVPGYGGDNASRLAGFRCLYAVDYTYFQTLVTVPAGGTVSEFTVAFSGIDDGARISVYNDAYPAGLVVDGSYVYLGGSGTTNLASYMRVGVNRVVITQLDDCATGNTLREARVVVNGVVVPPAPAAPLITTAVSVSSISLSESFTDTATVTGPAGGPTPTGTVDFSVYGPNDATCAGPPVSSSTNSPMTSGTATSGTFTPAAAGTYRVIAVYSGDANYLPVSGACNDANESVVVAAVAPLITTAVSDSSISLGESFTDTATVTGPAGGPTPTGTVDFSVYGPNDATCAGPPVSTSLSRSMVGGTATSGSFSPAAVGTYRVIATYSGDANYLQVSGACNDPNEMVTVSFPEAHMTLGKSASPTSGDAPLPVTYTYTLVNDGTDPIFHTAVTDDSCGPVALQSGDANANQLLDLGETWTLTCSQTLTATNTNTAMATGTSTQTGRGVTSNSAQVTVTVNPMAPPGAGMSLTKSANPTSGTAPLPVTYTYTLTNTGSQPLGQTAVTDDSCSPVTLSSGDGNNNGLLEPGETWTFTCSQTLTSTNTNTAVANAVSAQSGLGVRSNTAQATVTVNPANPPGSGMSLTKSANPTSGQAPLPVTYTYTLANTGSESLFHTAVTDDSCSPVTLQSGDNANQLLDPGETWTLTCSHTLTGTNTNTAVGRGTSTQTGLGVTSNTAQATVTVTGGSPPPPSGTPPVREGLSLSKAASTTAGAAPLAVTYTYTLANNGTETTFHTTVTDDRCTPVTFQSGDADNDQLLDPGETWTLTCSATLNATTTNTATAQGTSTQTGLAVTSNTAQATVTIT